MGLIHKYREFYGVQIPPARGIAFDTVEKVKLEKDLSFASMPSCWIRPSGCLDAEYANSG